MDFSFLSRTLPGIERLEPVDEETCNLTVKMLVPALTGSYQGTVTIVEKEPIDSYRLRGEAKGRLGWVRGDARFELVEEAEGTNVSSQMIFQAGGTLSGVGQRFMEGIAKSMLREFFDAFGRELATDGANDTSEESP